MSAEKMCPSCGESKDPDTGFHRDVSRPDMKTTYCRDCLRARKRAYRETDAGQVQRQKENRLYRARLAARDMLGREVDYAGMDPALLYEERRLMQNVLRTRRTSDADKRRAKAVLTVVNDLIEKMEAS